MAHWITDANKKRIKVAGNYALKEREAFLMAHPIGSYYISQNPTSPAELYGGGWEELDAGKTIWTIPTTETGAGEIIEAGLPNITGWYNWVQAGKDAGYGGAFSGTKQSGGTNQVTSSTAFWNVSFNANNGASVKGIYGNSNTVQPPAVKVYMWKRYQ